MVAQDTLHRILVKQGFDKSNIRTAHAEGIVNNQRYPMAMRHLVHIAMKILCGNWRDLPLRALQYQLQYTQDWRRSQ